jgi:hypothetical protein
MYTLEADRNDNPKNGVSTLDLVRLQQHLLGISPLNSPYLLIAADANKSGNVSALDLLDIRKLILGKYTEFPNNTSWIFIPENYVFADPYNPWPFEEQTSFMVDNSGVVEDFMGVKIGDLNATANAHLNMIVPRSQATIAFEAIDRQVAEGETFEVEFDLADFNDKVLGGQWNLVFDGAVLQQVQPLASGLSEEMWNAGPADIRFAWTAKEAVQTSGVIKLVMKAIKAGKISEMIRVDHSFMVSEIYNQDQDVFTVTLSWKDQAGFAEGEEIQLHQNMPNPWESETVIPFDIDHAGAVTLSITNSLGEEMTVLTQTFAAGKQQFKITNHSWPQGLYYYTIHFGDTQLTKTMLILNKH